MLKQGWYAVKNCNNEITLHFINNDQPLCHTIKDISKLGDRIFKLEDESGCFHCYFCSRSLSVHLKEVNEDSTLKILSNVGSKPNLKITAIDDKYSQIQTKCPKCKTKVCFYSNGVKKEHYCTVCNKVVEIPLEVVA